MAQDARRVLPLSPERVRTGRAAARQRPESGAESAGQGMEAGPGSKSLVSGGCSGEVLGPERAPSYILKIHFFLIGG